MLSEDHVAIWNAINAYATACGGDVGKDTVGKHRMDAVGAVETAIRTALEADRLARGERGPHVEACELEEYGVCTCPVAPAAPPADVLAVAAHGLHQAIGLKDRCGNTHDSQPCVAIQKWLATYRSSRTAGAEEALEATNAFYYASWEVGMRDAANIADCYTNGRDAAQEISAALKRKRAEWDARARAGTHTPATTTVTVADATNTTPAMICVHGRAGGIYCPHCMGAPTGGDSGTAKRGSAPPGVVDEGIETHGAVGVQKTTRCRIYDTACISPERCADEDTCCAGDDRR